jgi:glycogen debranching enzyme
MSVGTRPNVTSGHNMFDSIYKLAYDEVGLNSKESIQDGGFNNNNPIRASVFQTGDLWKYVWTRDISYSVQLALASVDPRRAKNSLLFKISYLKSCGNLQIMQDTGSGGSYPISTDRVVWAIAAEELLKYLAGRSRSEFLNAAYEAITNTIEHDRKMVFDEKDRLYKGEESFLDWREQSYPQWTWDDTIKIGISKALSTNILHYKILDVASKLAEEKGMAADKQRYSDWAKELKEKIIEKFYHDGLYSAMIFGDTCPITMQAYDLLGNALAVIFKIANDQQAASVVSRYPHTQIGAPVVFPQRREITNPDKEGFNDEHGFQKPYHNMAIWPFVTAYWIKAAAKAKNSSVVDRGVKFLMDKANENNSNMENYACFDGNTKTCMNSRYQLWSVAGYIAMVHDVVFGLDVNQEGIRFLPFITNEMCKCSLFA